MTAVLDIVCLGEPMVEFNQREDGLFARGFGGDTSNAAVCAARQGAAVSYLTALGVDDFGDDLVGMWEAEGINTAHVMRDPNHPTAIYFVTHDDRGHHYNYRRAGSAASHMRPGCFEDSAIAMAKYLHVSAISQAISASAADTVFAAIECAKSNDTRVSYDTNLRLNLWPIKRARAVVHEAMCVCDLALPSYDDAVELTLLDDPDAIVDFYLHLGASTVVLKLGAEGAIVATTSERQRVDGLRVNSIDANGAGDTFAGALLAELSRGSAIHDAARYANAAAAISTAGKGAVTSIPTRTAVSQLLGTL
jgi:2-dehydro-3-deoxygluconokinase